jgi:ABC-type transport system substrate-binding protein
MPTYMAPGVAWTESEREAVELLFESLVKQLPEFIAGSQNVADRYVPGLAESMPELSAQLVRTFQLPRETVWLGPDKALPLSGSDVRNSARLLGNQNRPGYNRPLGEMIEDVKTGGDDRHVNVTLQHGFLDPYSLLTFKILPDQAAGKDYKDGFARQPIGSGPYRLDGIRTIDAEQRMVFLANPYYSARPGRQGLPRIREIHFVVSPAPDEMLRKDKLDLLMPEVVRDLGAEKLEALRSSTKVVGPLPTRRIYFLAINHRQPIFQGDKGTAIRRAIAYAIPRLEILAKGLGLPGDQPLNGPYPPGSWASDPKIKTLDNPDIARGLKAEVQSNPAAKNPIKLLYPKDDKRLDAAMDIIRDRLDQTLGLKVELVAADSRELHDRVEVSHAYDLAYYHYDFPSEAYWLWPLFYPDDNYLGYFGDGSLHGMFRRSMARRDFAEVRRLTHDIHNYINQKMLIVPLWQLAGYYAIRDGYETGPVDPLAVLGNVEQWKPKR